MDRSYTAPATTEVLKYTIILAALAHEQAINYWRWRSTLVIKIPIHLHRPVKIGGGAILPPATTMYIYCHARHACLHLGSFKRADHLAGGRDLFTVVVMEHGQY